jgi:hypothetical protein
MEVRIMDERTMEDMLLGLFDPLMTDHEWTALRQEYAITSVRPLDEADGGGVDAPAGIELAFDDGTVIWLIIAQM